MRITDNLKKDISNAPSWFLDALEIKPSELLIKNTKGDFSEIEPLNPSNKNDAIEGKFIKFLK